MPPGLRFLLGMGCPKQMTREAQPILGASHVKIKFATCFTRFRGLVSRSRDIGYKY